LTAALGHEHQFAPPRPSDRCGFAQETFAGLARALVNNPRLLILDEPLGQLDSLTRITMQSELVSLWQRAGFTALLVTHDVEEALFLAGRVIVLSERPPVSSRNHQLLAISPRSRRSTSIRASP